MSKKNEMTLYDHIMVDTSRNRTPDLSTLRYAGTQRVFLWDDLQDPIALYNELLMSLESDDYKFIYPKAVTKDKFLPFYNLADTDTMRYAGVCLEETADLQYIVNLPAHCEAEEKPMVGKIAEVSLRALQELDEYYDNEYNYSRVEIEVFPYRSAAKTIKVWVYLNDLQDVAEWSEAKQEWIVAPHIDVTPFVEVDGLYTMGSAV